MRHPLTGEAREKKVQEILAEYPNLTRARLEEWAKMGRPMEDGELAKAMADRARSRQKTRENPYRKYLWR